jgi:hypothetical protein
MTRGPKTRVTLLPLWIRMLGRILKTIQYRHPKSSETIGLWKVEFHRQNLIQGGNNETGKNHVCNPLFKLVAWNDCGTG